MNVPLFKDNLPTRKIEPGVMWWWAVEVRFPAGTRWVQCGWTLLRRTAERHSAEAMVRAVERLRADVVDTERTFPYSDRVHL